MSPAFSLNVYISQSLVPGPQPDPFCIGCLDTHPLPGFWFHPAHSYLRTFALAVSSIQNTVTTDLHMVRAFTSFISLLYHCVGQSHALPFSRKLHFLGSFAPWLPLGLIQWEALEEDWKKGEARVFLLSLLAEGRSIVWMYHSLSKVCYPLGVEGVLCSDSGTQILRNFPKGPWNSIPNSQLQSLHGAGSAGPIHREKINVIPTSHHI